MSTTNRTTKKGGKSNKMDTNLAKTKTETSSKTDPPKSSEKVQPTAEQMRIAEIMDTRSEDPSLKEKIKEVMDLTQKSELEVMSAFMDNDNDANLAVNSLLEGTKNEWSTSVVKKKKNRTASTTKSETVVNNHVGETEDWDSPGDTGTVMTGGHGRGQSQNDRERPRQRGSGPPRMRGRGSLDNRGWRGRENKENERNLEEGASGERGNRRGGRMSNGPGRSGRGGRGGGRLGPRTFQSRDKSGQGFPRSIDTWNNPSTDDNSGEKMENWTDFPSPEDWDNEEYTGSLADSKVFTPSSGPEPSSTATGETPVGDNSDLTSSCSNAATTPVQAHVLEAQQTTSKPSQLSSSPVGVNTLTSAQTQYFNQISQASESFKSAVGLGGTSPHTLPSQQGPPQQQNAYPVTQSPNLSYTATSVAYASSNYGVTVNSYNSSQISDKNSVPKSKPVQRTRIPSSSKIPSSAVEMPPGDTVNSGIGFLDVQFGGLEFGSSDSGGIDTSSVTENITPTPPVPTSVPAPTVGAASSAQTPAVAVVSVVDAYATSVSNTSQQTSIASALAQTQKLTMGESMLHTEPVVSSGYGTSQGTGRSANSASSSTLTELSNTASKTSANVDVPLAYSSVSEQNSIYQTPTAYQKTTAASSYQTAVSTYNSSNYSTPQQVTSANSGYSSSQSSGYTSSSATGTNSGYGGVSSTVQSTPSVNSYPNANSYGGNQQTSYPYQSYPTASGGYQGGGQGYPPQSVYGATAGTAYPYQNSYPANTPASASTQQNHKITTGLGASSSKDSQYESGTVSNVTIPSVTTVSATPSLGLSAANQTAVSTKVTAISTGSKSGVVPNIPPGVPQMLGTQYIMSQGGLPYFHQQPMYSFEDLQMMQQRIPPHMNCVMQTTSYYDMAFQQAPTSLATGRDGSLTSVAYSMSDGRFGRADNNASPVPSTLSQQNATQTHQQPTMINPGLPPGYAYVYGNMIPGNFQYGAPTIYPMAPTAATAGHGNSNSGQYKGPGGYGSAGGYTSGYEAGATDYNKVGAGAGAYAGAPTQTKSGAGVGGTPAGANPSSTSTDLAANMYSKSHAALSKVNSYDKQSFHSATPPPFNLTSSQNTGLAPSGAYPPHLFIPPMAPHQQHHSAALMHQPLHQMDMRNQGRRTDGGSNTGPRSQASSQPNKAGTKQNYSPSYSQLSTHGYLS